MPEIITEVKKYRKGWTGGLPEVEDCRLCFYKFAGNAKQMPDWCTKYRKYQPDCKDHKNTVSINGEIHTFINPLNA